MAIVVLSESQQVHDNYSKSDQTESTDQEKWNKYCNDKCFDWRQDDENKQEG